MKLSAVTISAITFATIPIFQFIMGNWGLYFVLIPYFVIVCIHVYVLQVKFILRINMFKLITKKNALNPLEREIVYGPYAQLRPHQFFNDGKCNIFWVGKPGPSRRNNSRVDRKFFKLIHVAIPRYT